MLIFRDQFSWYVLNTTECLRLYRPPKSYKSHDFIVFAFFKLLFTTLKSYGLPNHGIMINITI